MRVRSARLLTFFATLLLSAPAWALNGEIYSWGGGKEVSDAFNMIALIFSDPNYQSVFAVVLVLAITGGVAKWLMEAAHGGSRSLVSIFIPILIGIAIHRGLIMPTGQLVIYDPVVNEFNTVSGVPDGIVMLASSFNAFQQGIVNIVNQAGPLDYNDQAGGIAFDLAQRMGDTLVLDDQYLNGSIKNYIRDCVVPELASPTAGAAQMTVNTIYNNTAFWGGGGVFAAASNPALYTTFYKDSGDMCANESLGEGYGNTYYQGCVDTCADAFAEITAAVQDPNAFLKATANMCAGSGFDPSNPTEMQQCQAALTNTINQIVTNSSTGGAANATTVTMQNIAIQNATAVALNESIAQLSPTQETAVLAQRQAGQTMMAVGLQANMWIPALMAVTFAVFVGLTPFLCIFLVTPFSGQVVKLIVGFFFLITTWGAVDATIHTLGMNSALRSMSEIAQYGLGFYSMMNFPLMSQKAAGLYGQLRLEGFLFSTFIAGAFGFTTMSAFSHFVMGLQGAVSQGAASAANTVLTPSGRGAFAQANATGAAQNEKFSNDPAFSDAWMNATKTGMEKHAFADPYTDKAAISRVQGDMAAGLTPDMLGQSMSATDQLQQGQQQGARDRLKGLQEAGALDKDAGLMDLGRAEGHSGRAGTEAGEVGYTVDGQGRVVMSTTSTGASEVGAGYKLDYDTKTGQLVSADLKNFTPSLDKSMRDVKRDGWTQRIAATSAFQEIVQHGSQHGQRYGKSAETADQLSNSVNQQMTQTISNDRGLQTRLMNSIEKNKHLEAGVHIGIPQAITRVTGLSGSEGGGASISWRDSSGTEYTSRITSGDSEAFTTAYNHAVNNSVRTMSSTESGSQDLQNLMRSAGLTKEASELHSIDTERGLTEAQRYNATAGFVEHVGQTKFDFMPPGKNRDATAAHWINAAAKGDRPADVQELSRLAEDYMQSPAEGLKPADTEKVKDSTTQKIDGLKEREAAAAPMLDQAKHASETAEIQSHQQAAPAPLVKPSADDVQIKRDAREDEISAGTQQMTQGPLDKIKEIIHKTKEPHGEQQEAGEPTKLPAKAGNKTQQVKRDDPNDALPKNFHINNINNEKE